jgi:hypothetical protein
MAIDDLGREVSANASARDRWIAVYIGALAVVLAICALGGGNAMKDATGSNIETANTWAFFQAKNMRRHVLRLQIDELETLLSTQSGLDESARAMITEKIAKYRQQDAQLSSDPASGEGLDQLFAKAKGLEERRDLALERDPYFDYGQALLQIAIVMASVAIISGGNALLAVSGLLGLVGSLLTFNGFAMLWKLPFIG